MYAHDSGLNNDLCRLGESQYKYGLPKPQVILYMYNIGLTCA